MEDECLLTKNIFFDTGLRDLDDLEGEFRICDGAESLKLFIAKLSINSSFSMKTASFRDTLSCFFQDIIRFIKTRQEHSIKIKKNK